MSLVTMLDRCAGPWPDDPAVAPERRWVEPGERVPLPAQMDLVMMFDRDLYGGWELRYEVHRPGYLFGSAPWPAMGLLRQVRFVAGVAVRACALEYATDGRLARVLIELARVHRPGEIAG